MLNQGPYRSPGEVQPSRREWNRLEGGTFWAGVVFWLTVIPFCTFIVFFVRAKETDMKALMKHAIGITRAGVGILSVFAVVGAELSFPLSVSGIIILGALWITYAVGLSQQIAMGWSSDTYIRHPFIVLKNEAAYLRELEFPKELL